MKLIFFNSIKLPIKLKKITLSNTMSNVIDFNYFSFAQKALHISGFVKV